MKVSRGCLSLYALATLACSAGGPPDRRTLIDSRDTDDPRSLDPALSTDVPTGRAVAYLFDGLTQFDARGNIHPGLAASWAVSSDGLTYTFRLRGGVRFHDGSPFRAIQVIRSWMRVLDPAVKGGRGEPLYPIRGARDYAAGKAKSVSGLTAPNDSTLVVTLDQPLAIFPKLVAMPVAAIVPDNPPSNFGEHPVGTGPWKLAEWKHDDYLLFARNPSYWGGAPRADSLRARIIAEPSTAVAEFESGNVDVLQVPADQASDWLNDESRTPMLHSIASLQLVYIAINTTRGPLVDPRVRQAVNYAVDVNRIIERLVSGRGTRSAGVVPPALAGYDSTRRPYPFDTAKAKQLLREAGHPNGIDIELWTSTFPLYLRIAQTVQAYLSAAGIRTKIVQREPAASRSAARAGQTDMILKDWYADYPDGEDFLYPLLYGGNKGVGGNVSFYSNAQFDSTIARARREMNDSARVHLYRQADAIAFTDAPMLFLYFYNDLYAVQPWITGFDPPVIFTGQRWLSTTVARATSGGRQP